jgi:serine/threonine-protein kinase RsbW
MQRMVAQVVLRLLGPTDQLRLVWQVGETLLESMTFDEDPEGTRYNVLLALQEMVTNVLRHAYELDDGKPIEVAFTVDADAFEVMLRDQGPAFDPLAYDAADLLDLAEMPTEAGGFGIHIAKLVMDEVAYERTDGWNILRMKKLVRVTAAAR